MPQHTRVCSVLLHPVLYCIKHGHARCKRVQLRHITKQARKLRSGLMCRRLCRASSRGWLSLGTAPVNIPKSSVTYIHCLILLWKYQSRLLWRKTLGVATWHTHWPHELPPVQRCLYATKLLGTPQKTMFHTCAKFHGLKHCPCRAALGTEFHYENDRLWIYLGT